MNAWARPAFATALGRLDLLLHREVLRLRMRYQLSLDELRGLYISDEQVDDMIARQPSGPGPEQGTEQRAGPDVEAMTERVAALREPALAALAQDPPWSDLVRGYRLSPLQQEVLLVALAPELDPKYETLYAYLNNDIARRHPTLGLIHRLLGEDGPDGAGQARLHDLLSPSHRLFADGLLEPVAAAQPAHRLHTGVAVSPVLCQFMQGCAPFEEQLRPCAGLTVESYRDWERFPLPAALRERLAALTSALARQAAAPVLVLEGGRWSGRGQIARNLFAGADLSVLEIDLTALAGDAELRARRIVRLVQSARLGRAGLILDGLEVLVEEGGAGYWLRGALRALIDGARPVCIPVGPSLAWRRWLDGGRLMSLRIPPPSARDRQDNWSFRLDAAGLITQPADLDLVAGLFHLDFAQIQSAVDTLRLRRDLLADGQTSLVPAEDLVEAAKQQSLGEIGRLAQRVDTGFRRADLVLPPMVSVRIDEIVDAIRNRRLIYETWDMRRRVGSAPGLTVLFSGASGTGKTMSSSVIANELGLDLYRIELSGIVSKYIGETEKNLDRIFEAAVQANCILLFDEADALFGKRSDVKDAHDRYANIEVAYLLQKMENHDGTVVLTTNMSKGMDQAFMRRIHFIVEFPRPDVAQREQLWAGMFGERAPLAADVDFNFLARHLDNTGGDIKNIALDAATLAAASRQRIIDMGLLVRASARQMRKQGKMPSANEFKHYFNLVNAQSR